MDKTVPRGAAILLDFIRDTEVGRLDRASYDVIFANRQNTLRKPITSMTLGEVIAAQKGWSKANGSSAAGAYQFMRKTLTELKLELGLSDVQVFGPDLQDRLGFHLLKRRGYHEFVVGQITGRDFGKRLAQEWASFPVLADTKGASRQLKRGMSYYAGDGLNKSLVKPEKVEEVLAEVLAVARQAIDGTPAIKPKPTVEPEPASKGRGIAALIAAAVLGLGAWLASLPCNLFGVFCGG